MGWKELTTEERWKLIIAAIQSFATLGAFIVAVIGIWKVTPIISYQIKQQQTNETSWVDNDARYSTVAEEFVADAASWWNDRVRSYRRILQLIGDHPESGTQLTYEIQYGGGPKLDDITPDLMVVTAVDRKGGKEVVTAPVNAGAIPPSQYIHLRINQGAFSHLSTPQRERVEHSILRYMQEHMQPKVPPPYIRPGMSLQEVYDEISYPQDDREDASRHIVALKGVIDAALKE